MGLIGNKLDPFVPGIDGAWDRAKAAHLARRAGFGMRPDEVDALVGDGSAAAFNAAVDSFIDFSPDDTALDARIAALGFGVANPSSYFELAGHWFYRMTYTNQPLQEQLTLFYHDHFATQYAKIRTFVGGAFGDLDAQEQKATDIMRVQNYLFRRQGHLGFRQFLLDNTRDPAMLLFLDNFTNFRGRAQENYSRELMELFALGVDEYTEDDVREAARVLTGESIDNGGNLGYLYRTLVHDAEPKTVLGQVIGEPFDATETERLIDILLAQPAAGEFMAGKFISWFVTHEGDPQAVAELAAVLQGSGPPNNFQIGEALRTLFKSGYFYEPQNIGALYRTPPDFVVNMIRQLEISDADITTVAGFPRPDPIDAGDIWLFFAILSRQMGMGMFEPPNVGGWIQGPSWINSVNLIKRYNFGFFISLFIMPDRVLTYVPDPLNAGNEQILDAMIDRILQGELRFTEKQIIGEELANMDLNIAPFDITVVPGLEAYSSFAHFLYHLKIQTIVHLLAATPEYQLK